MSGSELWVCRYCRSVNGARADKCYRCHTPREVALAKPEELTVHREESIPEATGVYRSSELRAVALTVATFALILATVLGLWIAVQVDQLRLAGQDDAANQLLADRVAVLVSGPVLSALALITYALWISRLIANLPALGLGYSRVSPRWAFYEPFIPGRNLYSLPARAAEVIRKLDERAHDNVLIGLAWALVVAPIPLFAIVARIAYYFGSTADLLAIAGFGAPVVFAFQSVGLLIALIVVWRVEALQRAKADAVGVTRAHIPI
jgi:hypothetical protein